MKYYYRPGKNNKRRKVISILVATGLLVGGISILSSINSTAADLSNNVEFATLPPTVNEMVVTPEPVYATPEPTAIPTPEVTPVTYVNNGINKGDSVISTSSVNLRLGPTKESFKLGELPKNTTVDRIMSIGDWDLIKYNGRIAFVSTDYTSVCDADYNNEYYYIEKDYDVVRTSSGLYFRTGPSINEPDMCLLKKNTELVVIGRAIPYYNPSDVWYLVKYKDQIGFVNAAYTISLKDKLRSALPDVEDLTIKKMAYVTSRTDLINSKGESYKKIEEYQLVKVLVEYDNFTLVEYGDSIGLVHSSDIKSYSGNFVVVDLSDQKVYMYCNSDMVFEDVCTTGKNGMTTDAGAFKVSERTNSRYFSEDAQARYMWARFDGGNGLHDAPWESPSKFGSESYRKNNGSKGCVRLPDSAALFLRDYVKVGTKVLVKK